MKFLLVAIAVLGLSGAGLAEEPCGTERFAGSDFIVCTIDPDADDMRTVWRGEDGQPYRSFSRVEEAMRAEDEALVLAVNGGMYGADFAPVGLYVENEREMRAINLGSVEGPPARVPNFYKKPNGVFFIGADGAGVLPTETFVSRDMEVRFATQSGPMLVIEGQLHPALIEGSSDRTRRSGVGVCENGLVRIAVSERNVNFYDFASLFRDHLGCENALFLDGGRGVGLFSPALRRNDFSWHGGFGPMLVVVK